MDLTPALLVQIVGVGAALCSTTSFAPQLLKLWREKSGEAVSVGMYALTVTGFSLWSAYGLLLGSWPLVVSNLISLALSCAILVLKLRYRDRDAAAPVPT
jgi:MtN3 and saliva related transmembrane protein